jgi:hypothetical protein
MLRDDFVDQTIDLRLIRDVDLVNGCLAALGLDFGGNALEVVDPASGQRDSGAVRGKEFGGGCSNAAGSTGNDDDFVRHDISPRRLKWVERSVVLGDIFD